MGELTERLSALRFSALEVAVTSNNISKKTGKLQAVTSSIPSSATNQSVPTRAVWKPPVHTA